jgi:hypothetical protein
LKELKRKERHEKLKADLEKLKEERKTKGEDEKAK